MSDRYEPPSEFLQAVIADDAPLSGSEFGEANLRLLIRMTRDPDNAIRDWATFILAQEDVDAETVRDALVQAATDTVDTIRGEAILGLAKRDPNLALPLVQAALRARTAVAPLFDAAALCADPSLVEDLRRWARPSGDSFIDQLAADALAACEKPDFARRS